MSQNEVVERKNRHLLWTARALLFPMKFPKQFWADAVSTTCFLINRMSSTVFADPHLSDPAQDLDLPIALPKDELVTAGAPVSNPELIVKILSGLGPEFREISAAIRARDTAISYEELFVKLLNFELFLRHEDAKKLPSTITAAVATPTKFNSNNRNNRRQTNNSQQWRQNSRPSTLPQWQSDSNPNGVTRCQLCNRIGHTANVCCSKSHNHFEAKANYAAGLIVDTNPWIVDSGATHHITTESHNLQPYHGNEDVSMGDGSANAEATGARSDQQWTV
ncbi:hypothetical protein KY289_037768 [Solanum tuberosum]|nr:hypothetical protein KY289_037768 [Solanum tuberosum]